jgi:XTP/dITP diphosphohydrolase
MMKIVFATQNINKKNEISQIVGSKIDILSLQDIDCNDDIPETQPTIEGNASQKAYYIYDRYKINCFADDTGMEVKALFGAPGVYSARYAGESHNYEANLQKVLLEMSNELNRTARFKTVISLVIDGNEIQFEGIVNGKLLYEKRGENGFGYDPIFLPDGYNQTFAEMSAELKNSISHRGIAVRKLTEYLQNLV